ncbi:hypothetical protein AB0F57_35625 [Streptomyces tanashiensis]|uniref:hypothetical protein n=1 Tax=Streptomyces tanashiensis TaxID=67367 RepID=UPI0033DB35D0
MVSGVSGVRFLRRPPLSRGPPRIPPCGDTITHHPDFTRYGTTAAADRAVLDGGLAMAWTAIDLATCPARRERLLARVAARVAAN